MNLSVWCFPAWNYYLLYYRNSPSFLPFFLCRESAPSEDGYRFIHTASADLLQQFGLGVRKKVLSSASCGSSIAMFPSVSVLVCRGIRMVRAIRCMAAGPCHVLHYPFLLFQFLCIIEFPVIVTVGLGLQPRPLFFPLHPVPWRWRVRLRTAVKCLFLIIVIPIYMYGVIWTASGSSAYCSCTQLPPLLFLYYRSPNKDMVCSYSVY